MFGVVVRRDTIHSMNTVTSPALSLQISHLFIVGGRRISTNPPGLVRMTAPRRPGRGRERDQFFALITPYGEVRAGASFYEQLAEQCGAFYFKSNGSVTSGLREAVTAISGHLTEHNRIAGNNYQVSICCMALRDRELYAVRVGENAILLHNDGVFTSYPDELESMFTGQALGSNPVTDIRLQRFEISPNGQMPAQIAIIDGGFKRADRSALFDTLQSESAAQAADRLRPLAGSDAQTVIIRFNPAAIESPEPAGSDDQPDSIDSQLAAYSEYETFDSAPAAVESTVTAPDSADEQPPEAPRRSFLSAVKLPTVKLPSIRLPPRRTIAEVSDQPPESVVEATEDAVQESTPVEPTADDLPTPPPIESAPAEPPPPPARHPILGGVARALEGASRTATRIADRVAPSTPAAEDSPPTELAAVRAKIAAAEAVKAAEAAAALAQPSEQAVALPTTPDVPRIPAMLAAGIAILIPIVVVFIVVALRLAQADATQFEQMIQQIQTAAAQAEALPETEATTARKIWEGVLAQIDDVEDLSGRRNDPILIDVRVRALAVLDRFAGVTRREVVLLREFGETATLAGLVVRAGSDLYTLDAASSAVWYDRMNSSTNTVVRKGNAPIIARGQSVGSSSVREMIDLAWMAEGSVQNSVVALDTGGQLVVYSPAFAPASARRLAGVDLWQLPTAMAVWRNRLYVLDTGASQIWRYIPIGDTYPNPPEEYFDPNQINIQQYDLSNAVDLGIDGTGNLYILFADGQIRKFNGGVEQPFYLSDMPPDGIRSGTALYIDAESPLPAMYVLDGVDGSIVQMTLGGKFLHRFKPADQAEFPRPTSLYVDQDRLYIGSGSDVYFFTIADLPR